jgi:hypothetical protein
VTDEELARLRAHGNNISRYRRLLETDLSELERGFIEKRLNEERSAVESLADPAPFTQRAHWGRRKLRRDRL